METPDWTETTWKLDVNATSRAVKAAIERLGLLLEWEREDDWGNEFCFRTGPGGRTAEIVITGETLDVTSDATIVFELGDVEAFEPIAKLILKDVAKNLPYDPKDSRHRCFFCDALDIEQHTRAANTCARCTVSFCYVHGETDLCVACYFDLSKQKELRHLPQRLRARFRRWQWERARLWSATISTRRGNTHELDPLVWALRSKKRPTDASFEELIWDRIANDLDAAIEERGLREVRKEVEFYCDEPWGRDILLGLDSCHDGHQIAHCIGTIKTDTCHTHARDVRRVRLSRTEREQALLPDPSLARLAEFCSW